MPLNGLVKFSPSMIYTEIARNEVKINWFPYYLVFTKSQSSFASNQNPPFSAAWNDLNLACKSLKPIAVSLSVI